MSKIKINFQAPKGTCDILPEDQPYWERAYKVFKKLAEDYDFQRIDTPLLEETNLFVRGVGQATDIVEKQMYNLKTRGGDDLTLRPEGTAGVCRSYIENGLINLPQPVKLYYQGPMFRYEQPQAGRYRQFQQFGVEIIGSSEAILDAQVILFFFRALENLGLKKINVQINSIGCPVCRPAYRRVFLDYYRPKLKKLCADCSRRFKLNPLRLLDCKEEKCQAVKDQSPGMVDYLCEECQDHFKRVLEFLDELNLPYFLNRNLVRGLDYYTKTVFEICPDEEGDKKKAQSALASGGRYDDLMKLLGGKETPAVGCAAGLERIIALMKARGVKVKSALGPSIFLIQLGDLAKKKSLTLFDRLQKEGIASIESFSRDSIKSQLKIADKLGAKFALILGQQEALEGTIIIRDMATGVQEIIPLEKTIQILKKKSNKS